MKYVKVGSEKWDDDLDNLDISDGTKGALSAALANFLYGSGSQLAVYSDCDSSVKAEIGEKIIIDGDEHRLVCLDNKLSIEAFKHDKGG